VDLRALLGDLHPETVAAALREVDEADLRRELRGDLREEAVREVFARLPEFLHATEAEAVVGFEVDREPWTVRIGGGTCTAAPGADPAARVTLRLDAVDFLRTVVGVADTAALWLSGRLTLRGDEPFALELAAMFRAPTAEGRIDPLGAIDVTRIARVVKATKDGDLRERLRGGLRELVLEQIFVRVPEFVRPEKAAGVQGALKFVLTGRADGEADRYAIVFADGAVTGGRLDVPDPRVTIRLDAADFLKLVTSNLNPVLATVRGKIRLKGDVAFAASALGLFHIPSA
jgi:putative sterol carrier protein